MSVEQRDYDATQVQPEWKMGRLHQEALLQGLHLHSRQVNPSLDFGTVNLYLFVCVMLLIELSFQLIVRLVFKLGVLQPLLNLLHLLLLNLFI